MQTKNNINYKADNLSLQLQYDSSRLVTRCLSKAFQTLHSEAQNFEAKFHTTSTNWNLQLNSSKPNWQDTKNQKQQQIVKDLSFTKTKMSSTKSNWSDLNSSKAKKSASNKNAIKSKSKDRLNKNSEQQSSNSVTLDKLFGQTFKSVPLNQIEFEGSSPIPEDNEIAYLMEKFEIDEADEDLYSESNTQSRFNLESRQSLKKSSLRDLREQQISKQQKHSTIEERKVAKNNETFIYEETADAKIKRKIIEKYTKNPKQKFIAHQVDQLKSKIDEKQLYVESPRMNHQQQQNELRSSYQQQKQCNSQSPQRTYMDFGMKNTIDIVPSQNYKNNVRISQTNFYQKINHDDKNFEGHIAFRNSFYNTNKYQDYLKNQNIPRQPHQNQNGQNRELNLSSEEINDTLKQKLQHQREQINEIRIKEEDKFNKYASRFKLEKQDSYLEQKNKRMQTPNYLFRSELSQEIQNENQ